MWVKNPPPGTPEKRYVLCLSVDVVFQTVKLQTV